MSDTVNCRRCGGTGREPDLKAFGMRIRRERKARRWSLRELARRAACSPAFVCDVEHGRRGGGFGGSATHRIMTLLNISAPTVSPTSKE